MDTWLIILLVAVAVVLLVVLALYLSKRSRITRSKQREQAREQLHEARIRSARADKEQALAEEQAAAARREMAEVQERAAIAEREARERAGRAEEDRRAAEQLRARAQKVAPDLVHGGPAADHGVADPRHTAHGNGAPAQAPPGPADQPGTGGATRR